MVSLKEEEKKTKVENRLGEALKAGEIGKVGEQVAMTFLRQVKDFNILEKNSRSKRGEIDVICEKDGVLHFVEVKSTLMKTDCSGEGGYSPYYKNLDEISRDDFDAYDPVFRVNSRKIAKIKKTAAYYMQKHNPVEPEIRFDVIVVYVFGDKGLCRVSYHSNIFV